VSAGSDRRPSVFRRFVAKSEISFALLVSFAFAALYNRRFWSAALEAMPPRAIGDWIFFGSMFVVIWLLHAAVLVVVPGRRPFRIAIAFAFLAAAIGAYFADNYGVVIDREAIRNFFATDVREVRGLVNWRLVAYLTLLGILPGILALRVRLAPATWKRQLRRRAALVGVFVLVSASSIALLGPNYASFIREHKPVRFLITPANVVYGLASYAGRVRVPTGDTKLVDLEQPVTRTVAAARKPLLLFLVIGETARAQNFELGGYARATNPELAKRGVHYFGHVTSCGTSTAISLPCMFSGLGRAAFDVARVPRTTNLLDALAAGGVSVEWRDNNAGCKELCGRIRYIDVNAAAEPSQCGPTGCFDEAMLAGLGDFVAHVGADSVVVFHQIGSHGPAYADRYPRAFEVFKPACEGNELNRCTREEVVNAYDNSIRYTDYNLAKQIDALAANASAVDSVLLYVSDHGESLGEKGIYLHGAPYMLAPAEQTSVPLVAWLSEGYRSRMGVDAACLRAQSAKSWSHDNLYHTVLGVMGVKTGRYRADMDIMAACRSAR
jgi:lipid A ethanolaminephosphotransferase